jgi:hypothetical protein
MARPRKVFACDCETDPFVHERVPVPFLWGLYDGDQFLTFDKTEDFVAYVIDKEILLYAHNGGKFDFMFLLPFVGYTKAQIINGRIVSMMLGKAELRDSYSIIPEALKKFGGKLDIEIWKLEKSQRLKNRPEILRYLKQDCVGLYDAVVQYRLIAGTKKTIASNALAFCKKLGIDPGRTNHKFDQKYRRFYYGGRCECFIPGTHKNVKLIDIHSAYPFAMTHDHATGDNFVRLDNLNGLTTEEIQRSFIVIECTSHGAFPMRTREGLIFPHEYNEFHVTGWEYLVAKEYGLIENETIQEVRFTSDKINFTPYVKHWYNLKSATDKKADPVHYTIYKILMNSLYGKLSQNIMNYYDYKIVLAGERICYKPEYSLENEKLCSKCNELMSDHGWQKYLEFDNHEIHRRESLWQHKFKYGEDWEGKGLYNNVATGASVTGFTRAHLLRAMCQLGRENIIYSDTDGIVCKTSTDLSRIPFSDKLGEWELEGVGEIGHFAGKKLYGIKLANDKYKLATKGSRLNQKHMYKIIDGEQISYQEQDDATGYEQITRLMTGETIVWQNEAPSFKIDGSAKFVVRKIRATALKPSA